MMGADEHSYFFLRFLLLLSSLPDYARSPSIRRTPGGSGSYDVALGPPRSATVFLETWVTKRETFGWSLEGV
ncbi:hypothetical protein LY76DRAFT_596992 [Colletotrichum caudatum]|nr:hypothetical protein LY76DRAFT_596992 [Colletotrichum caudatum]